MPLANAHDAALATAWGRAGLSARLRWYWTACPAWSTCCSDFLDWPSYYQLSWCLQGIACTSAAVAGCFRLEMLIVSSSIWLILLLFKFVCCVCMLALFIGGFNGVRACCFPRALCNLKHLRTFWSTDAHLVLDVIIGPRRTFESLCTHFFWWKDTCDLYYGHRPCQA